MRSSTMRSMLSGLQRDRLRRRSRAARCRGANWKWPASWPMEPQMRKLLPVSSSPSERLRVIWRASSTSSASTPVSRWRDGSRARGRRRRSEGTREAGPRCGQNWCRPRCLHGWQADHECPRWRPNQQVPSSPKGAHMASAISMTDLTKEYPGVHALEGLSIEVPQGSIYGFLGANGAGKTTALKILADGPLVRLPGRQRDARDRSAAGESHKRAIGYLGQEPRFY